MNYYPEKSTVIFKDKPHKVIGVWKILNSIEYRLEGVNRHVLHSELKLKE